VATTKQATADTVADGRSFYQATDLVVDADYDGTLVSLTAGPSTAAAAKPPSTRVPLRSENAAPSPSTRPNGSSCSPRNHNPVRPTDGWSST
jgi:hypothetical protein